MWSEPTVSRFKRERQRTTYNLRFILFATLMENLSPSFALESIFFNMTTKQRKGLRASVIFMLTFMPGQACIKSLHKCDLQQWREDSRSFFQKLKEEELSRDITTSVIIL